MGVRAYLALGSNLGQRETYLRRAVEALEATGGISVRALSAVYETEPVGYVDQEAFLNMAVEVVTEREPLSLLAEILRIERTLDRVRMIRWGPRTIDIDILLYERRTVHLPELQIPHPLMTQRAFVLIPLRDILDERFWPFADTLEQLIQSAADKEGVRKWGRLDWETGSGPSAS